MEEYYCTRVEREAAERLQALLAKPDIQDEEFRTSEEFDPWDFFPAVYGSYSEAFDDLAIDVLERIAARRTHDGETLAHEIFREMLCTAELCTYGGSPRGCFPTLAFKPLLPILLERWKRYREIVWPD
jgi:hypothetical protein